MGTDSGCVLYAELGWGATDANCGQLIWGEGHELTWKLWFSFFVLHSAKLKFEMSISWRMSP